MVILMDKITIKNTLAHYKLKPDKNFGQNFLSDETVLNNIVAAAQIQKDDIILEIGPGIGALTEKLAATNCKKVIAVELDKRLKPVLNDLSKKYSNLEVIFDDILKLDLEKIVGENTFKVVANLPYYITTPIVMHFLENDLNYERLVIMVQKEVAQRMTSLPGGKSYGALSIAVQYRTEATLEFIVTSDAFIPPPSVDSAVVVCKKRKEKPIDIINEEQFFKIVKASFSQRRKIILNSLKNIGLTTEQTQNLLKISGIEEKRRAETLSLQEFATLENNFDKW